jgi:hypothetical protein
VIASSTTRSLYEDWLVRRERLEGLPGEIAGYRAVEMRLLDYLLRRYRDSPEAARPARFPLSKDLFVDHRAIIIHHHLGRGQIPDMSSQREASDHVRAVVERMQSPPAGSAADDAPPAFTVPPPADPVEAARARLCDSDPVVRIVAALDLGEAGDLDDIGLLSDLLSLPATPNSKEHPREREALLRAIEWLSGVSVEPFDLSGIVPPSPRPVPFLQVRRPRRRANRRADFYFYMSLAVLAAIIFIIGGMMLALAPP